MSGGDLAASPAKAPASPGLLAFWLRAAAERLRVRWTDRASSTKLKRQRIACQSSRGVRRQRQRRSSGSAQGSVGQHTVCHHSPQALAHPPSPHLAAHAGRGVPEGRVLNGLKLVVEHGHLHE